MFTRLAPPHWCFFFVREGGTDTGQSESASQRSNIVPLSPPSPRPLLSVRGHVWCVAGATHERDIKQREPTRNHTANGTAALRRAVLFCVTMTRDVRQVLGWNVFRLARCWDGGKRMLRHVTVTIVSHAQEGTQRVHNLESTTSSTEDGKPLCSARWGWAAAPCVLACCSLHGRFH